MGSVSSGFPVRFIVQTRAISTRGKQTKLYKGPNGSRGRKSSVYHRRLAWDRACMVCVLTSSSVAINRGCNLQVPLTLLNTALLN